MSVAVAILKIEGGRIAQVGNYGNQFFFILAI